MYENMDVLRMAHAMASHAAARQTTVARNIANADTPGYRAQDLPSFTEVWANGGDRLALRTTREGHLSDSLSRPVLRPEPLDTPLNPNGNSVSLEQEMIRSAELRHQHDMALSIYRSARNILRASLGR